LGVGRDWISRRGAGLGAEYEKHFCQRSDERERRRLGAAAAGSGDGKERRRQGVAARGGVVSYGAILLSRRRARTVNG